MPNNDWEVFDYLISDGETKLEIDYLTYSIFAHKKSHWIRHFTEQCGHAPAQAETDSWISQITDYDFNMMRTEAADFFHVAASEYMESDIMKAREEGSRDAIALSVAGILMQLKSVSGIKSQIILALATAILVPIILGGAIFCIRQFEHYMPGLMSLAGR